MRSRSLLPLGLLGLLGVLTIGAAILGVVSSPKLEFFSLPPSTPGAPAQFDAIVAHTMAAPSFTWHIPAGSGSLNETLIYQAPDRMRDQMGSTPSVAIGTTFYFQRNDLESFEDSSSAESNAWVRLRRTPSGYTSAHQYAMKFLTTLLTASSVQGSGHVFHVTFVYSDDPYAQGQVETDLTVRTNGTYVTSIAFTPHGEEFEFDRIQELNGSYVVRFSKFGDSPPVVAPKASSVDHDSPVCGPVTEGVSFCAG